MKRLAQQYAAWREAFNNRSRALRRAILDCGINHQRLTYSKTGAYNHAIHNWSLK